MTTQFIGQKPTFTALPNWLRGKATPLEGWILWCLQSHGPNIYPSLTTLAKEVGIAKSTLCKVLSRMETKGWMVREQGFLESGRKANTRYRLTIWDVSWQVQFDSPGDGLVRKTDQFDSPGDGQTIVRETDRDSPGDGHKEDQYKKINKKQVEPPFIPPTGERRDERDATHPNPDQVKIFGMDSRGSGHAQPQPQQPVKPWEPSPPAPNPEPQPKPMAEATIKPRARKRKKNFEPTEPDVPATLLPVVSELLQFWPTRSGVMSREAWELLLTNACKIQNHPDGGTEILRQQLQEGIDTKTDTGKGWRSLKYSNWLKYGTKATATPIMGTGFRRRPTQVESAADAIAFLNARDANHAAYANQPTQAKSAQYILAEAV